MTFRAVLRVGFPILLLVALAPSVDQAQVGPCELIPPEQCSSGLCETDGFVCTELDGHCGCLPRDFLNTPTPTATATVPPRTPASPAVCQGTVREIDLPSGTRHRLKCTGKWTDEEGKQRNCVPDKRMLHNGHHWESREVCVCQGRGEEEKPCRIVIRRSHGECSKSTGFCDEDSDCPRLEVCINIKSEVFCAGGDDCADGEKCCLERKKVGDTPPQSDVACRCMAAANCTQ